MNKILNSLSSSEKKLCEGLVEDASFQIEELSKLRQHISEHGWSEEYKNGANQYGRKPSIEAEMYIKISKQYVSTIRMLSMHLPTQAKQSEAHAGEALAAFIARGKNIRPSSSYDE